MADRPRGNDPAARLVAATGRRLYVTSLTLVALLVVGIGVTAVIATRGALDAEVDRALRIAADSAIARQDGEVPAQESSDSEDVTPGSSDTFVLYLDANGGLVADPSRIKLPGLPFVDALPGASSTGLDLRTVEPRESLVAPGGVELVEDIVAESDRLGRLVGDLLMLSSSGASDLVLDHNTVDLGELVRGAVRRIEPLAGERHVDVIVDSRGPTVVDGDRDRLVQLILILVDNAIDHAPAGTPVEVALTRHGGSALLSVTDQGPGIPANERERIFEPFARLDAAARPRRGGAGLGLAIARRIAAAHGGSIVATTGPHGGARFEVTLPTVHG